MRLLSGCTDADIEDKRRFSERILGVGDRSIEDADDDYIKVQMPRDLLIPTTGDPMADIVNSTYPNMLHNLHDPSFFCNRAILAPKNAIVDSVN
jgi:hypothetical protein